MNGGVGAMALAAVAAALMIAQQVAGKAARDALFLSHYDPSVLPKVMGASAFVSVIGVLATSAAMQRLTPGRAVPAAFVGNGALFAIEWVVLPANPGLVAWVIYLHIGVFGAIVISGFWSVVNERFDPHSAKKAIARIAAAAAFGGLLGGLSAERVAVVLSPRFMLIALAVMNVVCAVLVWAIGGPARRTVRPTADGTGPIAGFRILREHPYLQKLAALVAFVAMTAALLDYALKAQAHGRLESDATLMQFFALFYSATGLLTFVLQSLVARRALARFGLDGTIALLPAAVLLTGLLGAAVTRMWTVVLVKGVEAILTNSFFRSGYELLYTPLAAARKRATKTIIDVAFERFGDAVGSGLVMAVVVLAPEGSTVTAALAVACVFAGGALVLARTLRHGYVGALAESLRGGVVNLADADVVDATTRRTLSETTLALDRDRLLAEVAAIRRGDGTTPRTRPVASVRESAPGDDELLAAVEDLLSRERERVARALRPTTLDARIAPIAISLLGDDALHAPIREALRTLAPRIAGTLVDALRDGKLPPEVRRRVPRVLEVADSPVAVRGLVDALDDDRFDVRYHAAQSLSRVVARRPELAPPSERVLDAVRRELDVDRDALAAQQPLLDDDDDAPRWLDEILRAHIQASVEHVFTLLALVLDREPLLLSLRALYVEDPALRGTAVEYLENVLPPDVQEKLLPRLEERAKQERLERRRTREQLVDELQRSLDRLPRDRLASALRPKPSGGE